MVNRVPIGVVINPFAKSNIRNGDREHSVRQIVGDLGLVRLTHRPEDLADVMREFIEKGVLHVVYMGGDGTAQVGMTAMIKEVKALYPEGVSSDELLYFPYVHPANAGTINFTAKLAQINGTPEENLERLVFACERGVAFETFPLQTLKIITYDKNDPSTILGEEYGFVFGDGGVTNFLEKYYGNGDSVETAKFVWQMLSFVGRHAEDFVTGTQFVTKRLDKLVDQTAYEIDRPGVIKALRIIGKGLTSFAARTNFHRSLLRPKNAKVTIDGEELPYTQFNALGAGSLAINSIGIKPFYRLPSRNDAGNLHVYAADLSYGGLIWTFLKGWSGRYNFNFERGVEKLAQHMRLETTVPGRYTLDAELKNHSTVIEISRGPKLLVPMIYGDLPSLEY
ncbi:hypothetical protein HN587_03570 [Candidatus Woesearchaeota archaeon]|jgi:hypothetical protein|nr:hypothetical protein [Candidatus Woesearchaeota archaeon]